MGVKTVPTEEAAFVAKVREQIKFLKHQEYNYAHLRVYVSGIGEPWEFGREDEFEFEGDGMMIVRVGPTTDNENAGVPEYVFPIRQIVATELAISEE